MNWRDYKRLVYDELRQSDFRTKENVLKALEILL